MNFLVVTLQQLYLSIYLSHEISIQKGGYQVLQMVNGKKKGNRRIKTYEGTLTGKGLK